MSYFLTLRLAGYCLSFRSVTFEQAIILQLIPHGSCIKPLRLRLTHTKTKQHYHVRMHTQSVHFDQNHVRSDFARLGRILTGTAVGLVLGGGGARYVFFSRVCVIVCVLLSLSHTHTHTHTKLTAAWPTWGSSAS